LSSQIALTDTIKIAVGEGLTLSTSSSSQFWPILAHVMHHHEQVFPIGIYRVARFKIQKYGTYIFFIINKHFWITVLQVIDIF